MKTIHVVCLLMSILGFTSLTFAGGDTLGNGGGYAELRFLNVFRNIDKDLNFCVNDQNPCKFTTEDVSYLQELLRKKKGQNLSSVTFESSSENWVYQAEPRFGAGLKVNQARLYQNSGLSISQKSIVEYVLQINFYQMNLETTLGQTISRRISEFWNSSNVTKFTYNLGGNNILEAVVANGANSSFFEYYIRIFDFYIDVTDSFTKNSPCKGPLNAIKVKSVSFNKPSQEFSYYRLNGRVRYTCSEGQKKYEADYNVGFDETENKEPNVIVDLSQIQEL